MNSKRILERTIVWFRNDLRVSDNPLLTGATAAINNFKGKEKMSKETICIYCLDPKYFQNLSKFGSLRTGIAYTVYF